MKRKKIAILFGGKSYEHEISVKSARSLYSNIDREIFDPLLIGISHQGEWYRYKGSFDRIESIKKGLEGIIEMLRDVDVVFPLIHGAYGEDGRIQGFLEVLDIDYVGSKHLSSAICMDKAIAKSILRDAGIRVVDFLVYNEGEYEKIERRIGYPCYVKPSNGGSSLGISIASNRHELKEAIDLAKKYDSKVLIEKNIVGRELGCAVVYHEMVLKVSEPGEIITENGYTYAEKYKKTSRAKVIINTELEEEVKLQVMKIVSKTFNILQCRAMARIDLFLSTNKDIYINEVNTIPGFTDISLFPKMCECMGLSYKELITSLISQSCSL